jgi:hypothetical protein
MLVICVGLVSASVKTLGTFQRGTDIELRQTCTINGTFCDYCNISSFDYPNGTRAISDVEMTRRTGDFNYTVNSSTTNTSGSYKVNGYCGFGDDVIKNFVYWVNINPLGIEPTEQRTESITRSVYFIFGIGIILFVSFLFVKSSPPVKWTFFIFALIFFVIGLNVISISLADEVVNPRLESFFDSFSAISILFYWFAAGLLIIIWIFTFINTWLFARNLRNARRYGFA